jgi:hypothetical protein
VADHPYARRKIGLATMHAKERAMAAPFRRLLDADVVVAPRLDTDQLGTFSGEIPRPGDLIETALLKAELVFKTLDVDCALASEGSYGPIDRLPLNAGGLEIVAFLDRSRGIRMIETLRTHRTNWRLWRFKAGDPSVRASVASLGFPQHGVFVIPGSDPSRPIKDLASLDAAVAAVDRAANASADGEAIVISDMRAHRNPRRMQVLRALAWRLARRLSVLCPKCGAPGFGHIDSRRGLPCEDCGAPTHWIDFEVDGCAACGHGVARPRADGRRFAPRLSCTACRDHARVKATA